MPRVLKNGVALWLFLFLLSPRQLHACEFYDCWEEHSHCATLCKGGRWLDLTNAKATQHQNYMGGEYRASKAIDGNPYTCAMANVSHYATVFVCGILILHTCIRSNETYRAPKENPKWILDLQDVHQIAAIRITSRQTKTAADFYLTGVRCL